MKNHREMMKDDTYLDTYLTRKTEMKQQLNSEF